MSDSVVGSGRASMQAEAAAILAAASRLDEAFERAVGLLVERPGKVIVTGVGKSGLVARRLAAILCSTGTPAVFLHPLDAMHGDVGVCSPGDTVILFSKSGATLELLRLVPVLRGLRSPLIGILGNLGSALAQQMDVVLDGSVRAEACPFNLAPTASVAVATALGDALALAVMQTRQIGPHDFAQRHPAGQLGRNLRVSVREVMHAGEEVAWAEPDDPMHAVIIAMNRRPLGAAIVATPDGVLEGLITDGDLRRALQDNEDIRQVRARDLMTRRPVTIGPDALLQEALRLMEDRPSQISVLPVIEREVCLGLVRLHDLYQTEIL